MRHLKLVLLALALVALVAPTANAGPIEWHGGIFDLQLIYCGDDDCGTNQYMVRYSADLTNFQPYVGNAANWDLYIDAIAFKVGDAAPTSATVFATSAGVGGTSNWNPVALQSWMSGSGLGCSSGSASVICADATNVLAASTTTGATYYWDFLLTMPAGAVPDVFLQPIRAEFVNADGEHSGLLSETTTSVPEPSSLLLLGAGLFSVGFLVRRRRSS